MPSQNEGPADPDLIEYVQLMNLLPHLFPSECLPSNLAQLPLKDENPALINDQSEVLASDAAVSTERQVWGG